MKLLCAEFISRGIAVEFSSREKRRRPRGAAQARISAMSDADNRSARRVVADALPRRLCLLLTQLGRPIGALTRKGRAPFHAAALFNDCRGIWPLRAAATYFCDTAMTGDFRVARHISHFQCDASAFSSALRDGSKKRLLPIIVTPGRHTPDGRLSMKNRRDDADRRAA